MFRDPTTLLEYEAKRRPALAQMLATIDTVSDEQVRQCQLLPWMRKALLEIKREHRIYEHITHSVVADPMGEMREWTGNTQFIKVGRSHLEITAGQLVWFERHGVWIDSIYATIIDPLFATHSRSCGSISKSGYMAAVRHRTRGMIPSAEPSVAQPLSSVRFFHPGN